MSRTKHHKEQKRQHLGQDLWSPRAGMEGKAYCAYNKKLTRQRERAQERQLLTRIDTNERH